jgi:hypothetical protein
MAKGHNGEKNEKQIRINFRCKLDYSVSKKNKNKGYFVLCF